MKGRADKSSNLMATDASYTIGMNELNEAWLRVQTHGAAGGIDRVSVDAFAREAPVKLKRLAESLQDGSYVPEPYLSIQIPKNHKPGKRTLGLPCVADKIVQQVLLNRLNRFAAQTLLPCTYAYRPNKGPVKAVKQVMHLLGGTTDPWLVRADIDNFFDEIPHRLLEQKLLQYTGSVPLTGLCMLFVRMGNVDAGKNWKDRKAGIPQGALISPVIANLFLHDFDQAMMESGAGYVRYADDLIFTAASETEAQRFLSLAAQYLQTNYGMRFNTDAVICPATKGCEFLGVMLGSHGISLTASKQDILRKKLSDALQADGKTLPALHWKQTQEGIARYYGRLLPESGCYDIDRLTCDAIADVLAGTGQAGLSQPLRQLLPSMAWCSGLFRNEPNKAAALILEKLRAHQTQDIGKTNSKKIAGRKRFYEKLSDKHSELVLHTPGTFLSVAKGNILVKLNGKVLQTLRTGNLRHITISQMATGFSGKFIALCAEKGISLHFAQGKKHLFLNDPEQDDTRLWEWQLRHSHDSKGAEIARALVLSKIIASAHLLKYFLKYNRKNPDFKDHAQRALDAILRETACIESMATETILTNILELTAAEGRAAQAYWTAMSALSLKVDFPGRTGQGATDPVNAMLNYGYAILYNRVWESIRVVGLHTGISFLHVPVKGKATLAFDMMEPFRAQAVDRVVFRMVQLGQVKESNGRLSDALRKQLADAVLARLHRKELYRGSRRSLEDIIRINLFQLAAVLKEEDKKFKPYRGKW